MVCTKVTSLTGSDDDTDITEPDPHGPTRLLDMYAALDETAGTSSSELDDPEVRAMVERYTHEANCLRRRPVLVRG
jgi:hypothetical protein